MTRWRPALVALEYDIATKAIRDLTRWYNHLADHDRAVLWIESNNGRHLFLILRPAAFRANEV
jgi:hypothetical protein